MGLFYNWRIIVVIFTPLILIFIPLVWNGSTGKEPYAAYTISLMCIYWCTEAIPLPVTAFIPVIFFPLLGIMHTDDVSRIYFKNSIFFLLSGCIFAQSVEFRKVHVRVALKVITIVGTQIPQLMLGMMITAMFLSMWMNNTSTTAMMIPIVNAITEELRKTMLDDSPIDGSTLPKEGIESSGEESNAKNGGKSDADIQKIEKTIRKYKRMFLLATAYSSNIGGTGVVTGTAPNIIAMDLAREDAESAFATEECRQLMEITFLDWMLFNVPPMILNTFICWIYLLFYFLGIEWLKKSYKKDNATFELRVKRAVNKRYRSLGKLRFDEKMIMLLFLVLVMLWVFKDPKFIPGWDSLPFLPKKESGSKFITECTPTILICLILFIVPSKLEYFKSYMSGGLDKGIQDPLLAFEFIRANFPWGAFMLLGGGSAMAEGAKVSGLSTFITESLKSNQLLELMPEWGTFLVISILVVFLTSLASNTACCAIMIPIILSLSYTKSMHPLYLVYGASTVCSYAFALPVSTPPNALVFSATKLRLKDMLKPGIIINILTLGGLFLSTHTVANWIFKFSSYNGECDGLIELYKPHN